MRSFSLFTIVLLCIAILLVDLSTFYWLHSITQLIGSVFLKTSIHILFWVFTVGLIVSILILKVTLDDINPIRKQMLISKFYGLAVLSLVPKLIFVIVISVLYFTNYLFSESESLIIVPFIGLLSGFLPFFIILNGIFRAAYKFQVYNHRINSTLWRKILTVLKLFKYQIFI